MSCKWLVEGQLSKATYKVGSKGNGYWIALIRVENGEVCLYVHDLEIQRFLESAPLGAYVIASGIIEPHNRYSQAEKPYFLSPAVMTLKENG